MPGRRPGPTVVGVVTGAVAGAVLAGLMIAGRPQPAAAQAFAQVTVNPGALDLLPAAPARPASPRPQPRPAPRSPAAPRPATPGQAATPNPAGTQQAGTKPTGPNQAGATSAGAAASSATPAKPTPPPLPVVPPAIAALPPPLAVPPPRAQPVATVSVSPDAPGVASPVPNGTRVTFGTDRQDLNPGTEAALRAFARQMRGNDLATVNIYAYAAGTPDDPSTARRLALGRALAARAVLINEGVASTRIYPRSMPPTGSEPASDRVDVLLGPPGPPTSSGTGPAPTPTPGVPAR